MKPWRIETVNRGNGRIEVYMIRSGLKISILTGRPNGLEVLIRIQAEYGVMYWRNLSRAECRSLQI